MDSVGPTGSSFAKTFILFVELAIIKHIFFKFIIIRWYAKSRKCISAGSHLKLIDLLGGDRYESGHCTQDPFMDP